ncbi:hypothetical protein ACIGQE_21730 [Streptomyces sp. NPDC053429]|uniref:hypothetical protein n=1 Tax=Streptomyces sp. NPDC053429 TaxID=3365702 RepID=UPI0037D0A14D
MDRLIGCDRRPDLDRAVAADDQVAAATQGFDMLFMRGTPVVEVVAQEDVEGEAVPQALALDLPGQAQGGAGRRTKMSNRTFAVRGVT